MIPTDEMVDAAAKALSEAEASHDREVPWIVHPARTAVVTAALAKAPPMTSPVSAIEAIDRFERAVRANGYRTCDDHTEAEYKAARSVIVALARQAEALQRENAEKDARIAALEAGVSELVEIARQHVPSIPPDGPTTAEHQAAYEATGFAFVEIRKRARALLGGSENAE